MGLDLYAGTLARYYSGDWLTTVQQASAELGIPATVDYASGVSPWLQKERAAAAVDEFRAQLSETWGSRFPCFAQVPTWNEAETTPYQVDKPDHDGVRSLVLFAAYLERSDLTRPKVLPADYESDPAYAEATDRGYYMGSMVVFESQLFLPMDDNFVIVQADPLGAQRYITSLACLRSALVELNSRVWNADDRAIAAWARRGLVSWGPVIKTLKPGSNQVTEEPNTVVDKLEHNAQFAFACFWQLSQFAEAHNVPIVVDQ